VKVEGKAEWTITGVLTAANRAFKFARRRLDWHGENPVADLDRNERPKVAAASGRRRIYQGDELAPTLEAAHDPYRTLFSLAAVSGGRMSECLGLVWEDIAADDLDAAEVRFECQVDRHGNRQQLKTDESRRTVEIPRQLALMLTRLKLASANAQPDSFVFATRSGRALGQRNVIRELRNAQRRATDDAGRPTFPILHVRDDQGLPIPVPRGAVPSMHGFRHSAASEAIAAGDSAEEVSWQLGHRNSTVTREIYVQEIKTAERTARRRAQMEERYGAMLGSAMEATDGSTGQQAGANVAEIAPTRSVAQ